MNMKHAVIVLPTYNERGNIARLLESIQSQRQYLNGTNLSVLVVDDSSPDGTGEAIQKYSEKYSNIQLLNGTKKQGLGTAYIRGIKHAIYEMDADVVFQMDADLSHDPNVIPQLLAEVQNGSDFAIGSRYVEGGSIPSSWSWVRRANSRWGNIFARHIVGLSKVNDCTSGYRAIRSDVLKQIDFNNLSVKGYAFMISLLYQSLKRGASVSEIPINFTERVYGKSKLKLGDVIEFILISFIIRFPFLRWVPLFVISFLFSFTFSTLILHLVVLGIVTTKIALITFVSSLSLILSLQGLFTIIWMLYAWEDPENVDRHKSPKEFYPSKLSFTALIPARHEEKVIKDTIKAVNNINYPDHLKEVLILCREDDEETITKVKEAIEELNQKNIRLIVFDSFPINKPHCLNQGLKEAKNEIVAIFDAEDEPHPDIYNIINTVMIRDKVDVIQSGVQLMNYRSHWFSALNVMEYFLWFKSGLHFFLKIGNVTPLGGNTVFCKKNWLDKIKGWDENCLTEDTDIGIRLISSGAKVRIIYDEQHVTKEETPTSVASFIKQRTRWNQGFLQVFTKSDWTKMPQRRQKLVTLYFLLSPLSQAFFLLYAPIAIWVSFTQKMPLIVSIFSFLPLYLFILQLLVYVVGLYEFTKSYKLRFPFWMPLKILLTFYPYQFILMVSSFRALYRIIFNRNCWEKTLHTNGHRKMAEAPTFTGVLNTIEYVK